MCVLHKTCNRAHKFNRFAHCTLSLSLSLSLFHHIVHSVIFFLFFFSQYYIYKPQTQNICHILSIACEQKHNLFVYADVSCLFMFMQACLFMFVMQAYQFMFVYEACIFKLIYAGVSVYVRCNTTTHPTYKTNNYRHLNKITQTR